MQHADASDPLPSAVRSHADETVQSLRHRVAETRLEQGERRQHAGARLVAGLQRTLHKLQTVPLREGQRILRVEINRGQEGPPPAKINHISRSLFIS